MGGGQVLDEPELAWPPRLWYDAEWGGLKGAQKRFCFLSSDRADVSLLLELSLYKKIKFGLVLGDGWPIWWGESLKDRWNAGVESETEVVGNVWVPEL